MFTGCALRTTLPKSQCPRLLGQVRYRTSYCCATMSCCLAVQGLLPEFQAHTLCRKSANASPTIAHLLVRGFGCGNHLFPLDNPSKRRCQLFFSSPGRIGAIEYLTQILLVPPHLLRKHFACDGIVVHFTNKPPCPLCRHTNILTPLQLNS